MNDDRVLSAAVALLCVLALGITATSMESSLSSDPTDVVRSVGDGLPYDDDDFSEVREAVRADDQGDQASARRASEGDPEQQLPSSGDRDGERRAESSDQLESAGGGGQGQGSGEQNRVEQTIALWPWLLVLLGGALAYRYRDRLRAILAAFFGDDATDAGRVVQVEPDPWADLDPSNEVERAWVTMVQGAGLSRPWVKTPGECARAAVDAGMDPEAVERITRAFVEVRYGDAPVTERHARLARRGLSELEERRWAA